MTMHIGFIGLGQMGNPMSKNLLKAGHELTVYDLRDESIQALVQHGAVAAKNSKEVAERSEIVFTMLPMAPFDPTLSNEILGPKGVLSGLRSRGIILDGGNTSPVEIQRIAKLAKEKGVDVLDIPLSGGPEGAEKGTLSIMVGGEKEAFERVSGVLAAIGSKITYFGPTGMGQVVKLVNNMIVNIGLATISEALVFGTKAGVDPKKMYEAIRGGAASSWVIDIYGSGILNREKSQTNKGGGFSGVRIGGRDKQLGWAFDMASEMDVPVPLTAAAHEVYKMARCLGKGGLYEPIIEMWEQMTDTEVVAK